MKKILLDTDIGYDIDDALCLSYLLSNDECDLLGITTVTGKPYERAKIASVLCTQAGKNIPICVGTEKPVLMAKSPQQLADQSKRIGEWPYNEDFSDLSAVEFLHKKISEFPDEITLLCIGPLTNIALLFTQYPNDAEKLCEIVIMGGDFRTKCHDEWNIKCDPEAAEIVFRAGYKKLTIVPLDVTLTVSIPHEEMKARCKEKQNLLPVYDFLDAWRHQVIFHDPLAGAVALDDTVCRYVNGIPQVILGDGAARGFTVLREGDPAEESRCRVAISADKEGFLSHYFDVLK